jgi:hypothetical protein
MMKHGRSLLKAEREVFPTRHMRQEVATHQYDLLRLTPHSFVIYPNQYARVDPLNVITLVVSVAKGQIFYHFHSLDFAPTKKLRALFH